MIDYLKMSESSKSSGEMSEISGTNETDAIHRRISDGNASSPKRKRPSTPLSTMKKARSSASPCKEAKENLHPAAEKLKTNEKDTLHKNKSELINNDNSVETGEEKEHENTQKESDNTISSGNINEADNSGPSVLDLKAKKYVISNETTSDESDARSTKPNDYVARTDNNEEIKKEDKHNGAKTSSSRRKSQSPTKFTYVFKSRNSPETTLNGSEKVRKSNRTPKKSALLKEHEESQNLFKKSEMSEIQSPERDGREPKPSISPNQKKSGRPKGSKNKAPRKDKGKGKRKKRKNKDIGNQPNLSIDPRFGGKVNLPPSSKSKVEKQTELKGPKVQITCQSNSIKLIKFTDQEEENKEKKMMKIVKDQQRLYKANIILTENKDTVEKSWVCLFCKKLSHEQGLGDLFGPYFVTKPDDDDDDAAFQSSSSQSKVDGDELETWFHERCLYWAPNIYMLSGKIIGVEVVIRELKNSACNHCHIEGATISCYHRGCENRSHFPCSVGKWQLIEDIYQCYCPRHHL